ncbi:MAG: HlyD family type I secretion periplasmic adaptor subunit [Sulfuricurvum sp.]|nr:HlyD family type I secretion periplasmic adaptor subunit [Sulfuricurvum sp.]
MKEDYLAEVVKTTQYPTPQTNDKGYRRLGWIVLGGFVGVFGVWAAFAPLESAIPVSGKMIVASSNQIVQHLEGGIVKSILTSDGAQVKKGEDLIVLDDTQAATQLNIIEAQYYELLALEGRLAAERDHASDIVFSPELSKMEAAARAVVTENQRRQFTARDRALKDESEILTQRIEQMHNQIEGLEAIVKSKTSLANSYRDEVKEWEVLYAQQLIDKIRLRDVKRQMVNTEGEIANAKADIARAKAQISEMNAQKISMKANFIKDVLAQISDTQTKLSDMRARASGYKDMLQRAHITAPMDGTVTNLAIRTVGGVIPAGRPILEIVPQGEPLIIEAQAVATESANIHVGLKADIQFPSFQHVKTLKEVKGEVIHIGADTIPNEADHQLYYPVKIRITPEGEAELLKNHLVLQSGIPATAMIVVASRTFADYLIHPFKTMFKKSFNEQ